MKNPEYAKLFAESETELADALKEFLEEMDKRTETEDISQYLTMDQLETLWSSLESKTKKIYSDVVQASLAKASEKRMIESKKENTKKRG